MRHLKIDVSIKKVDHHCCRATYTVSKNERNSVINFMN